MGERIRLTASDGFTLNAYRAEPSRPAKAAVVVIQEVWGLNRWIRSEVERYAAEGYTAIAPAIMDRVELGYESEDYGPSGFARIGELMKAFRPATLLPDVEAAVKNVAQAGKVGITGYCFGGRTAWLAANAGLGVTAASGYYGGGVPTYLDLAPRIPIEMHFGAEDTGIPTDQIEALRKKHPNVPIYLYPAGHGFCNRDREDAYHVKSAHLANARTLEFFAQHLF